MAIAFLLLQQKTNLEMNSTNFTNTIQQKESATGEIQDSRAALVVATADIATTRPLLCQSPHKATSNDGGSAIAKIPKQLAILLSSPLFATTPSGMPDVNGSTFVNTNSSEIETSGPEEKNEKATPKQRAARVSLGNDASIGSVATIECNGSSCGHDLDGEGEPHKKRRKRRGSHPLGEHSFAQGEDRCALSKDGSTKESDDLKGVSVDFDGDAPASLFWTLKEEDANPYGETITKVDRWSSELLVLKKELEGARVGHL